MWKIGGKGSVKKSSGNIIDIDMAAFRSLEKASNKSGILRQQSVAFLEMSARGLK